MYKVQGYFDDTRIVQKQTNKPKDLVRILDGSKVTEIQLQATIKSRDEITDLIDFLEISLNSL